jgi:hypothetical protein
MTNKEAALGSDIGDAPFISISFGIYYYAIDWQFKKIK